MIVENIGEYEDTDSELAKDTIRRSYKEEYIKKYFKIIERLRKALMKEYKRKGYGIEYSQKRIEHIIKGDKEYD